MKLTELESRWIHPNVFVFLCPHCRSVLLSCKNIAMAWAEQCILFKKEFGPDYAEHVITTRDECSWSITGTQPQSGAAFPNDLSVTPSIDASGSGHWHGYITRGEIC